MALKRIRGSRGELIIPSLGAVVARIDGRDGGWWEVDQREADGGSSNSGPYRLRALFTDVNQHLINDPDYTYQLVVWLTAEKRFAVQWGGGRLAFTGRTLTIERGVSLVEVE